MKKFINKHKTKFLMIVCALFGGTVVASAETVATIFSSSEVSYSNENMDATNVQDAIDELYEKAFPPEPTVATDYLTTLASTDSTLITDDYGNIRYSGKNVNNYVCMANEETCSDANLYRIIGVFSGIKKTEGGTGETRIKLIKATNNGKAYWNAPTEDGGTNNNNWTEASLKNTLNSASTPIYSSSLIDNAVWNIGARASASTTLSVTSSQFYLDERGTTGGNNNAYPTTWTGKVALMYPSDYGYASSNCYSTMNLGGGSGSGTSATDYRNTNCTGSNWLYLGSAEWLLTPSSSNSYIAFGVPSSGFVSALYASTNTYAVRPAVYLKSDVSIVTDDGRDGSSKKPYLLSQ